MGHGLKDSKSKESNGSLLTVDNLAKRQSGFEAKNEMNDSRLPKYLSTACSR